MSESGIASGLISRKIPNIVKDDFSPTFSLKHMQKDLGLLIRTADELNVPLPVSGVIYQLFTASKAQGDAEKDSSAIYRLFANLAGLSRSST
jgi:3-hydroxyisobutyrate dehydrogenase-like beta-hydroxyacid dehydrogenase